VMLYLTRMQEAIAPKTRSCFDMFSCKMPKLDFLCELLKQVCSSTRHSFLARTGQDDKQSSQSMNRN